MKQKLISVCGLNGRWKQPEGGSHLVRVANASCAVIPEVSSVSDRSPDRHR